MTFSNEMHLCCGLGEEVNLPLDEDLFIAELEKRKQEELAKEGSK